MEAEHSDSIFDIDTVGNLVILAGIVAIFGLAARSLFFG
jgi:hypothetical protein